MSNSRHIEPGTIADLADTLLMARAEPGDRVDPHGRAVFWVGAGTSVSAGIPSGRALAGRLAQWIAAKLGHVATPPDNDDFTSHEMAFAELQRVGKIGRHHTLGTAYGDLFSLLGANDQRDFIRRVIVRTNRRQINWAHLAIGELVRQRIVHTLLTTNFDDLLLDGLVRCDQLPAIIDGVESLRRMDPQPPVPQLVYLHGSQHTYSPRNSSEALSETRDLPQAQGGLYGLLQHCSVLVVVGYAGNPGEGVMELLLKHCRCFTELPIYWVAHGQQDSLSEATIELLSSSRHSRLIPGQDADLFFRALLREMRIGVPTWFHGPVKHLLHLADRIRVEPTLQSAELREEVDDFCLRLRELLPLWEQVGAQNLERRELRQLMLSDNYREVWRRLKDRMLDDVALLQVRAQAAYELGRLGLDDTLERSVRDWSAVARRLEPGSAEWALAHERLGEAHATLGERKGQARAVRNSVDAYELALSVHSREAMPIRWASTRNNQGLALLGLAQLRAHGDGAGGDQQALRDAQDAFRDALSEYRPDAMPTEWAAAKRNLGRALQVLGRAGDPALMEEAVAAYAEALQIQGRAQRTADWAMTTCHWAVALIELAALREGEWPLRKAASALAEALQGVARDSQPTQWAVIKNHHGAALLALGQRGDEAALKQAIVVLRQALEAPAPGPIPAVDWAAMSGHLGGTLLRLALGGDDAALAEANALLVRAGESVGGASALPEQALEAAALAQSVMDELQALAAHLPAPIPGLSGASAGAPPPSPALDAGSRVLVVEDSEVDRLQLEAMLRQCIANLELRTHTTGKAALAELFQFGPDLLILDLNLPDMQGGEVLACAKAINPSLPVLLYSGDPQAMSQLRLQAERGTRIATLHKGCALNEFVGLVPTLFRRRQRDGFDGQRAAAGA